MVCQLLAKAGVSFGAPADLVAGDRWNAKGYFEAKAVMDVNSRMITGLPRHGSPFVTWLSKVAYLRMPSRAAIDSRAERCRASVQALGERFRDGALKDPRFCLTLRYWQRWAPVDHVVVCLRHPSAVVNSMVRRHWLPRWLGARFYAWHVDALLEQLAETRAVFVDVDRLVAGSIDELDALLGALGLAAGMPTTELLQSVVVAESFGSAERPAAVPAVARNAWQRLTERAAVGNKATAAARAR